MADYRRMMETDSQVKACIMLKILGRLSTGWSIEPASDDPQDQQIAEFIEAQLPKRLRCA